MSNVEGFTASFKGKFDFGVFEEEFHHIVAEYCIPSCNYAIKCMFIDNDGYFGGWSEKYSGKAELVNSISINDFFEN